MSNFFELKNLERFYFDHPDSIAFAFLAAQYLEAEVKDKALAIAEKGVRKHPTYAFGHYVLALCHYELKGLTKAKTHLELSLAYDDKNPQAWKLMSEINDRLELPLLARDALLQFFLLDPFNKESARRLQHLEMIEFNEFDSISFGPEGGEEERHSEDGDAERARAEEEATIEELFSSDTEEEDINITQKIDEVFKETLGDISVETHLDANREAVEQEAQEAEDIPEDRDVAEEEPPEAESPAPEPEPERPSRPESQKQVEKFLAGDEDEEDIDIVAELDEFFAEYEMEEDLSEEPSSSTEETEADFGNILFEDLPAEEPDEEAGLAEDEDDELLDYNSVVDEMSSEEPEETPEEPVFKLSRQSERPPAEEAETPRPPLRITTPKSENKPKFGRPPILSPTLGEIYISQGRFEEAIEVFQQLLEKDPQNSRFQKKIKDIQAMLEKQRS